MGTITAILAATKAACCHQLLNEDLKHGQDYDGVVVVNPFLTRCKAIE